MSREELEVRAIGKGTSEEEEEEEEEEIYYNVDDEVRARMNSLFQKSGGTSGLHCSKKKPMPSPKPSAIADSIKRTNKDVARSGSEVPRPDYNQTLSTTEALSPDRADDDDDPIYDDACISLSNPGPRRGLSEVGPSASTVEGSESIYEDAKEVIGYRVPICLASSSQTTEATTFSETDEGELYSEAIPVVFGQSDESKTSDRPREPERVLICADSANWDQSPNGADDENLYEDVQNYNNKISNSVVLRSSSLRDSKLEPCYRIGKNVSLFPGGVGVGMLEQQSENDADLYEEAAAVRPHRLVNEERSGGEETLYEEAASVAADRLKGSERQSKTVLEELYEEVAPVWLQRLPASEEPAEEEPLYEEALSVKPNRWEKERSFRPLLQKQRPIKEEEEREEEEKEEALYDNPEVVISDRLPQEEKAVRQPGTGLLRGGKTENPYRRAVSVRGSFMEDSSDEDEPTSYNILLVKMSFGRANRLFHVNLDSQLTMGMLEKKAKRLSTIFGRTVVRTATESVNTDHHHRLLKPVKSDSSAQLKSSEYEAFSAEDDMESEVTDSLLPPVVDNEQMVMRKWILNHILESEKSYLNMLDLLFEHMQAFKSVAKTERCVIQPRDNDVIFYKIAKLHECHFQFVNQLGRKLDSGGTGAEEVGEIFRNFADLEFSIAREYLQNYHKAISTIDRCRTESPSFAELAKEITVKLGSANIKSSKFSLEELLHKPVVRFQQITLSIRDLIKSTPVTHPDYDMLQKTMKNTLYFLNECLDSKNANIRHQRYLVKHSLVLEKEEDLRKLRHVFLFSDVLICAKHKLNARRNRNYRIKWFIPLQDLQLEEKFSAQVEKKSAMLLHQQVIDNLEKELVRLQAELKNEVKKCKLPYEALHNRKIESLQKKIFNQEAALLEASPYLELKLMNTKLSRNYIFLLSSDYERTMWKDSINGMSGKVNKLAPTITSADVDSLLQSQRFPKVIQSVLKSKGTSMEKECLSGSLKITIHKLQGLTEVVDAFCVIELDSFGHFFMKAKTNQCKSKEPSWEEDFDLDLEGAQTLHLLCYRIGQDTDQLVGKCSLELNNVWLSQDFERQPIPLTEQTMLTISLKYTPQEQLMRRSANLSLAKGMFGVKLEHISKREGRLVPLIVTSCIEQIEARGLDELGLYRVSGLSSEIERLKTAFNKNAVAAAALTKEADVNVLTSLIKFFFRELPESVFTDAAYLQFIKGIGLADPEAKEKFLVSALMTIPKCNYATATYVLNHLMRVIQNKEKNKMTLENVATVFGPTLLHPAETDRRKPLTMEQRLWLGTNDIALQVMILLYFLQLKSDDYNFPK